MARAGVSGGGSFASQSPDSRAFSAKPPIMRFAQAARRRNHNVARRKFRMRGARDATREIDAGNHREATHHRSLAGDGETVLVVDRRESDVNVDIALHQIALTHDDVIGVLAVIVFVDANGSEVSHMAAPPPLAAPNQRFFAEKKRQKKENMRPSWP